MPLTRNNRFMVVKHRVVRCLPNQCAVGLPALNMLRFGFWVFLKKVIRSFLDLMATGKIVQLEFNDLFLY